MDIIINILFKSQQMDQPPLHLVVGWLTGSLSTLGTTSASRSGIVDGCSTTYISGGRHSSARWTSSSGSIIFYNPQNQISFLWTATAAAVVVVEKKSPSDTLNGAPDWYKIHLCCWPTSINPLDQQQPRHHHHHHHHHMPIISTGPSIRGRMKRKSKEV